MSQMNQNKRKIGIVLILATTIFFVLPVLAQTPPPADSGTECFSDQTLRPGDCAAAKCCANCQCRLADGGNYQCYNCPTAETTADQKAQPLTPPTLQIEVPGAELASSVPVVTELGKQYYYIPWIAQYVGAVYKFGVWAATILSVVVLIIAGFMWLTAGGSSEQVTTAKTYITGAIVGLVIALGSYTVLKIVNPALVYLKPIKIQYVDYQEIPEYNYLMPPVGSLASTTDSTACPAGASSLASIVDYSMGQTLQYSQPKRGQCADGACYCDCSWLGLHLAKCSGLPTVAGEGTSRGLIGNPNKKKIEPKDCDNPPVKAGDILVWNDGTMGHVLTYIGNNQIIECGGGGVGVTKKSGALKISTWKEKCTNYFLKKPSGMYYINR